MPGPSTRAIRRGAGDVETAGRAEREPLVARQIEKDLERLAILDPPGVVHLQAFEIAGNAIDPDPLGDRTTFGLEHPARVPGMQGCARRIRQADCDPGIALSQIGRDPRKGCLPVPAAQTNPSIRPPVCSQISRPVVS